MSSRFSVSHEMMNTPEATSQSRSRGLRLCQRIFELGLPMRFTTGTGGSSSTGGSGKRLSATSRFELAEMRSPDRYPRFQCERAWGILHDSRPHGKANRGGEGMNTNNRLPCNLTHERSHKCLQYVDY